jgi:hypothetical protein
MKNLKGNFCRFGLLEFFIIIIMIMNPDMDRKNQIDEKKKKEKKRAYIGAQKKNKRKGKALKTTILWSQR